jgi:peptidoglycan/LPS O-acetylase OafA/YrhL
VSAHLLNLIHPFLYYRVLQMELVKLVYLGALFAGGALLAVLFPKLPSAAIRNKTVVVCAIGLVVALATHVYGVATFFLLPPLVIAFGTLNYPSLSWIRKYGDISYGVYIWGYFVQQALVYLFHFNYIWLAVVSIPISWLLGFLSWHLIEKKPLQLKMRKKPQPELVAS